MEDELIKDVSEILEPSQWGSDEMNLAEFPIGVLSEKQPPKVKTIEREDTAWCQKRKIHFSRKVTVTAIDKWGLPCAGDNDVLLAIISLTKKANNFSSRELQFNRAQIARELGWDQNGRTYKRIKIALHRLSGVRVIWERSFFDNHEKRHATKDTGILDGFELYERFADGQLFDVDGRPSKLFWSEELFKSFGANYVKSINMEVYRNLSLPIARQIFRLLDKRFHFDGKFRMKLREFSQKIGLSEYRFESKIKEKIAPSIKALEENGVIRPESRYEAGSRHGEYWIVFTQGDYERKKRNRRYSRKSVKPNPIPKNDPSKSCNLVDELISRGLSSEKAKRLLSSSNENVVRKAIKQWDFLCSTGNSPRGGGWLIKNIESGGYSNPIGFDEGKGQNRKVEKKPQADPLQDWEERSQRDFSERLLGFQKYFSTLTDPQQKIYLKQAMALASPFEKDVLKRNSNASETLRLELMLKAFESNPELSGTVGSCEMSPGLNREKK